MLRRRHQLPERSAAIAERSDKRECQPQLREQLRRGGASSPLSVFRLGSSDVSRNHTLPFHVGHSVQGQFDHLPPVSRSSVQDLEFGAA